MTEFLTFLLLGICFGFLHSLEPDHLVGVATIASTTQSKRLAFNRGAIWGIGHTLTILVLYMLVQGLGLVIEETLSNKKLESLVGFMLIILGLRIWYKLLKDKYHFHPHNHTDGNQHLHIHSHKAKNTHEHVHLPFGIGIIHGLAGSGAVILALSIKAPSYVLGALYIILFGLGSCIAMGLFSGFLVGSINKTGKWVKNYDNAVTISMSIIGIVSCILGYGIIRNSGIF